MIVICLAAVSGLTIFLLTNPKPFELSGNKTPFEKASLFIELADSIRNADPDTAIFYYNEVLALLEHSVNDSKRDHLRASSYVGLAYVHSGKGESKLAFKNDSIALAIAVLNNDQPIKATAWLIKGMIHYTLSEYENALTCYQAALDLALELQDLELQAKIFSNRSMIYFYQGENQKTIEGFTKALAIGKQLNNEPLISGNYMNLAVVYSNLSENDSVLVYYERALALFLKLNDKNGELKCYNNIGNIYYDFSDFGKAIEYYQLSLKLALEMDDKSNTAKMYHNLAEVYIHLGDNDIAAELLFKSIKIKEQLNDKRSLSKGYFGLGEMYYNRNDYPKSIAYFKKSLKLSQEINYHTQIGSNYSSIGSVYSDQNKQDSALFYYGKAMDLYKQIDYFHGISNLCINLGDVYRELKDYSRSEKLLMQALKTKTELEEEEGVAIVYHHLANLYFSKANALSENQKNELLKKAEEAGLHSYHLAKRLGTLPVQRDVSKALKKIFMQQGRLREAMEYAEISSALSDSILNKEKIQALTFAEARWNVEKKQKEIENLENTQKLQKEIIQQKETESRQDKVIIWIVVALLILTLISAVIVTLYLRKRRDAMYQKQLVKMTALRMQNARNTMSPHFFFNVLASLSGLSAHPEVLNSKLKSLSLLLRKVIENIDRTAVTLDEELSAVKAFVDLCSDKIPAPFTVEYSIEEGTKLKGLIPAMMIQIPVENAIKHGLMPLEGEKKLTISITDHDEYQQITVTDNGIGLKASSGRSTGTGTGLKVLMQTIHLLNTNNSSKIKFTVKEREAMNGTASGTAVDIQIPNSFNYTL